MPNEPIIERTLPPPLAEVSWSADIVSQSLEILPIFRDDAGIAWLKPVHADSLRVGTPPSRAPADVILAALARYRLEPSVVHSTSWRTEDDRMILTYAAIVSSHSFPPEGPLTERRVTRAELARGEAKAAPKVIGIDQVIEHALRHLAWLMRDDPAIAAALADWRTTLGDYVPEPFRAFEG